MKAAPSVVLRGWKDYMSPSFWSVAQQQLTLPLTSKADWFRVEKDQEKTLIK
ncbi:MAG: hypothetical protein AAB779_00430 [Patescibacteria group bacterium]